MGGHDIYETLQKKRLKRGREKECSLKKKNNTIRQEVIICLYSNHSSNVCIQCFYVVWFACILFGTVYNLNNILYIMFLWTSVRFTLFACLRACFGYVYA